MEGKSTFGRNTYVYNYDEMIGDKIYSYILIAPMQHQEGVVGIENIMNSIPIFDDPNYKGSGKLKDKVII